MNDWGTRLHTWLRGRGVGEDAFGNCYFESRSGGKRRWVLYKGMAEASKVPAEWHAWLHRTADAPLTAAKPWPWQKPHQPNLSGTIHAYRPPGHFLEKGARDRATGDYTAWTPPS